MADPNQDKTDALAGRFLDMCAGIWAAQGMDPTALGAACLSFAVNGGVRASGADAMADLLEATADQLRAAARAVD